MVAYSTNSMITAERVDTKQNTEQEPAVYGRRTVINTVNAVYKRMAASIGRISSKVDAGEDVSDLEKELYNGWAITRDGICLLRGRTKVDPVSPIPADIADDKFTVTLQDGKTGYDYEAPARLPVEYLIATIDISIADAQGEIIGVRDRKERGRILKKIADRQDERKVLAGSSIKITEEQADLIADAIHREAHLIAGNPQRTYKDNMQNHLKGERIIVKERKGLIIPPANPEEAPEYDYNYIATYPDTDLRGCLNLFSPSGLIKRLFRKTQDSAAAGISDSGPAYITDESGAIIGRWNLFDYLRNFNRDDRLTYADIEASLKGYGFGDELRDLLDLLKDSSSRGVASLRKRMRGKGEDKLTDRDVIRAFDDWSGRSATPEDVARMRIWVRNIFDYLRYSGRDRYRAVAEGLGGMGSYMRDALPESMRRRADLLRRRFPDIEIRSDGDRRWLAGAALLALLALAAGVGLKSCGFFDGQTRTDIQRPAPTTVATGPYIPDGPDYGTRGVFPEEGLGGNEKKPQPEVKDIRIPENITQIPKKGITVKDGDYLKEIIEQAIREAAPEKSAKVISAARLGLVWEVANANGLRDPDLIKPEQLLLIPDSATLRTLMDNFDPDDPKTAEALKYFANVKRAPEDMLAAGISAEMWLQDMVAGKR